MGCPADMPTGHGAGAPSGGTLSVVAAHIHRTGHVVIAMSHGPPAASNRSSRVPVRRAAAEPPNVPPAPPDDSSFEFNVYSDRNYPSRRTMEDAHAFAYDFGGVKDQGFFAVFDGHGGKSASRWAATHFQLVLERHLRAGPEQDGLELLRATFRDVDAQMSGENGIHSGCTAVVCFLRTETSAGQPRRVLYTGNVGDARAVLFRDRAALRLSHDHKASDPLEQKRIKDAGGFVTNDRVNGILAVARSLGDHEMKEFVIGEPHTSRTELDAKDTVLVLACDGVWDILDDQAVCEMADQYSDPLDAAKAITDRSIEEGSSDNISTMVVYLQRRRQPGSIK